MSNIIFRPNTVPSSTFEGIAIYREYVWDAFDVYSFQRSLFNMLMFVRPEDTVYVHSSEDFSHLPKEMLEMMRLLDGCRYSLKFVVPEVKEIIRAKATSYAAKKARQGELFEKPYLGQSRIPNHNTNGSTDALKKYFKFDFPPEEKYVPMVDHKRIERSTRAWTPNKIELDSIDDAIEQTKFIMRTGIPIHHFLGVVTEIDLRKVMQANAICDWFFIPNCTRQKILTKLGIGMSTYERYSPYLGVLSRPVKL